MTEEFEPEVIAFVEAYIQAGFKAGPAYRSIHSDITEGSSWTLGSRMLRKVEVQKLLKEFSVSMGESMALLAIRARDDSDKQVQIRAIGLALKTHGLLLDRSEVKLKGEISWREFISPDGKNGSGDGNSDSYPV